MAAAAMASASGRLLFLFMCFAGLLRLNSGETNSQDAAALQALLSQLSNAPPRWGNSNDPCGMSWEGVTCTNSRVTSLILSTMGIKGTLSGDIGQLTALQYLDLSYNSNLGGPLPANIADLKQLTSLSVAFCSFSGEIPWQLGNLANLSFLALNSNHFSGEIPAFLGLLSNVYWIDLGDNQLVGSIPISANSTPGLDMLINTKHFHFNKNQLSGQIPEQLFSSRMTLIHILFDNNQFNGTIPESIGQVQTLEIIRLDKNLLSGPVPTNISNLTGLYELHLANNRLTGPLPDLTGINNLNYIDLSNNSFSPSEIPPWFSTLSALSALVIESGGLTGPIPTALFALPQLQQVILANNKLNGTLDMGNITISSSLQLVNAENNEIDVVIQTSSYTNTLLLAGNPVCNSNSNANYCRLQQQQQPPYSTSLAKCGSASCPADQNLDPESCACAYPYQGLMVFRAPMFGDVTNSTVFQELETSLSTSLSLTPGSVYISDVFFNGDNYLQLQVALFPSSGSYFNRTEVLRIGFDLSSQIYKAPFDFGPYYFSAFPYPFQGGSSKSGLSTGAIAGIAAGSGLLVLALIGVGVYALRQKRRATKALEQTQPFASWGAGDQDAGSAPKVKGARWFSFDEVKKCTNNFADNNELGAGGYGKVYRGVVSDGQIVAIKRAQQGSMQGALEFKTEIELLSRLHHKNLVELVGFCYDQGEQMLVYEYIPNGTLRENLIGKGGGKQLDWGRRLKIALDSARGLAYLHELANPPIIHRDVKSANILLDENLTAKVADFGLSKLISDTQKTHVSTQVKGTLGYLDPEYYMTQQLSDKSDVYSFGVVMLELISGKLPIEKGKYIVREVKLAVNEEDEVYNGLEDIIDPVLLNSSNLVGFTRFVQLALQCVEESAASRPSMNEVVKEIETLLQSQGMKTISSASSAAEFGSTKGAPLHPYDDSMPSNYENSTGAFEYSGGYSLPKHVEPK